MLRVLAISGSARRESTNTALLKALRDLAPAGIAVTVFDGVGGLPVFSPDLDDAPPPSVRDFIAAVGAADGVLIACPEYVRSIPGGLKNAVDWLVSRDTLVAKPIALLHASHRGDDMLAALRLVLATVSTRFAPDIFLRLPLMKLTPSEVAAFVVRPETVRELQTYLAAFAERCAAA